MVLCKPGSVKAEDNVKAQVYLLSEAECGRKKPVTPLLQLQMFCRTWDCATQVNTYDKEMLMPGEDAT